MISVSSMWTIVLSANGIEIINSVTLTLPAGELVNDPGGLRAGTMVDPFLEPREIVTFTTPSGTYQVTQGAVYAGDGFIFYPDNIDAAPVTTAEAVSGLIANVGAVSVRPSANPRFTFGRNLGANERFFIIEESFSNGMADSFFFLAPIDADGNRIGTFEIPYPLSTSWGGPLFYSDNFLETFGDRGAVAFIGSSFTLADFGDPAQLMGVQGFQIVGDNLPDPNRHLDPSIFGSAIEVPEPGGAVLVGLGFGLTLIRRRRRA